MNSYTLLNWLWMVSWQGAALALVVWGITCLCPRTTARWRYALWLLVLLKFCLPPVVNVNDLTAWLPRSHAAPAAASVVTQLKAGTPIATVPAPTAEVSAPLAPVAPARSTRAADFSLVLPWLLWSWVAGMAGMLGWLVLRAWRVRQLLRHTSPVSAELQMAFAAAVVQLKLTRQPALCFSTDAGTPMVVGFVRPTILLPVDICAHCAPGEITAILLHELAHIKRRDIACMWLQQFVRAVYFFHPAVWVLSRQLDRLREMACDETVLTRAGIAPRDYAAGYVSALRLAQAVPRRLPALAMAEPFAVEEQRVKSMLRPMSPRMPRRWVFALLLLALLGLPTLNGIGPRLFAASSQPVWSRAGGNGHGSGIGLSSPQLSKIAWSFDAGGHVGASAAIDAEGTIYVPSCGGNLYALDGKTGAKRWAKKFTAASALLTDGRDYGTTPTLGSNGLMYYSSNYGFLLALEMKTGETRWRFDFDGPTRNPSPVIGKDGTVFFAVAGGVPTKLYALDGETGKTRWTYQPGVFGGRNITAGPALTSDGTVVICMQDMVYGFAPDTGAVRWTYQVQDGNQTGDDPHTRTLLNGNHETVVIGPDDTVHLNDCDGKIYALDGKTGKLRWSYTYSSRGNRDMLYAPPAVGADGTVYFTTGENALYAVDNTGKLRWRTKHQGFLNSPTIGADGTVYVIGIMNGSTEQLFSISMAAVNGRTGEILQELKISRETTGGWGTSSPAIGADGTLYVGTREGKVLAIR